MTADAKPQAADADAEFLDAALVARKLGISLRRLRDMARRGEYPELLHVTRGEYRVRKSDHEAWMAERWTGAEAARAEIHAERMRAALMGRD